MGCAHVPMLGIADASGLGLLLSTALLAPLLCLSAAFACSETVLFSLSASHLQQAAVSHNPLRRLAAQLMRTPERTLRVILIGNTAVNVLIYATSYLLFARLEGLGEWAAILAAAVSVTLVAVLGEVVPKVVGVALAERLAPLAAAGVHVSSFVLGPLARVIDLVLVRPTERLVLGERREAAGGEHALTTSELKALLDLSRRHGSIDPSEDELLREVVDLHHLHVRDVMVPRVELITYDVNAPPSGLRELMRRTRRKKIPVYSGSVDNIVGLVYAKVLFFNPDRPLRELVQPVRFVPEIITCEQLLLHLRNTRSQLAIVVDEYGGVAGLVTLEDLLEQIVGDIRRPDEGPSEPEIVPVSDSEYEIGGSLSVHYWTEAFRLGRLTERVATVGGLVTARLGRAARVGDVVQIANVRLEVLAVQRRRIERLRVTLLQPGGAEAERPTA